MIVVCPSCSTPWQRPGASAATARCGRCDECFQLREERRPYRLGSSEVASPLLGVARLPIGMDDPRLAAQLAASASERPSGQSMVLTYRVVPASSAETSGTVAESPSEEPAATRPFWETEAAAVDPSIEAPGSVAEAPSMPEPAVATAEQQERPPVAARRFGAIWAPTWVALALGMGLAYALASWRQTDPTDWTILGGALGLLAGLLCRHWTRGRAD